MTYFLDLRSLLGTADLLVKAFDSACQSVGHLSELIHNNCKAIDAVVCDTVEFEGQAVAEEALLTDVSAINGIMDKFTTQEVDSALFVEYREPSSSALYRLVCKSLFSFFIFILSY